MGKPIFQPLPDKPDHPRLEEEILDALGGARERSRSCASRTPTARRSRFIDGPVTANRFSLGVHTAWGRTLKDVFQRYKALRGFHQRYQNGFDCQGLWIEVGVERELGLNSKREIEEFGLEEFARRCRDVVVRSSEALTRGSIRLGQWMDWGNDYFTFSDTNIEYVWRMLKSVHERGLALQGPPLDRVVPALRHVDLPARADRLVRRSRRPVALRPLPAARAAGRVPRRSGRRRRGRCPPTSPPRSIPTRSTAGARTASGSRRARYPDEELADKRARLGARRLDVPRPVRRPRAGLRRRAPRHPVGRRLDGRGHRHRPHRARAAAPRTSSSPASHGLAVVQPVDEAGRFYDTFGWLHGLSTTEAAEQIIGNLEEKGILVEAGLHEHRYPECWRCHTPLIFRIADDWFISVRDLRQPMLDANATVEWTPEYMGKRMDDWLRNMGDWNISRRRYYGLPLPFYPCGVRASERDRFARGARGARGLGARPARGAAAARGSTALPVRCEKCGEPVERIAEVGDVWLDAGIVPFSTLGWQNPELVPEGYGDRRGRRA